MLGWLVAKGKKLFKLAYGFEIEGQKNNVKAMWAPFLFWIYIFIVSSLLRQFYVTIMSIYITLIILYKHILNVVVNM